MGQMDKLREMTLQFAVFEEIKENKEREDNF